MATVLLHAEVVSDYYAFVGFLLAADYYIHQSWSSPLPASISIIQWLLEWYDGCHWLSRWLSHQLQRIWTYDAVLGRSLYVATVCWWTRSSTCIGNEVCLTFLFFTFVDMLRLFYADKYNIRSIWFNGFGRLQQWPGYLQVLRMGSTYASGVFQL